MTIGPEGDVEGEIHARQVVVGGRVKGDVHAAERAELTSSGAVEGSVHAPKVVIAEGARLEGSVAMSGERTPASAVANPSENSPASNPSEERAPGDAGPSSGSQSY